VKRVFLDSNIFVYSLDSRDPVKRDKALALIEQAISEQTLVTSSQVIQEFLHVATAKFRHAMSATEARLYAESILWPWCSVFPNPPLYASALAIREGTGWSFYDALIVAAALEAGCDRLYTEDLQSGRTIRRLNIRNPFV
jgi:predicted nucleic acid-binding protein